MDNTRKSIINNEDSISMYLSFDADDTLASKWLSLASQTSQYLETQTAQMDDENDNTLEEKDSKTSVIKHVIGCNGTEPASPLRPFDKSILNKHNALSSTPSKNAAVSEVRLLKAVLGTPKNMNDYNKENTYPDVGAENSTLDATGSTVKLNTLIDDIINDEVSVKEADKTNANNAIATKVVLEDIIRVSHEESALVTPSPLPVDKLNQLPNEEPALVAPSSLPIEKLTELPDEEPPLVAPSPLPLVKQTHLGVNEVTQNAHISEVVDEVSELISKALKMSEESININRPSVKTSNKLPLSTAMPISRPRRSYLPTASGEPRTYSLKQRMSVVVKTTLNSPARKLATSSAHGIARRSCMPASRLMTTTNIGAARRSSLTVATKSTSQAKNFQKHNQDTVKPAMKNNADIKYNCKICHATFRVKGLYDMHVRMHSLIDNGPKSQKKINNPDNPTKSVAVANGFQNNRCKYCDKNFALERALHIHLMQNCVKIPPNEKRKLEFTELNHVAKAQLPKINVLPVVGASANPRKTMLEKDLKDTAAKSIAIPSPMQAPSVKKVPKKMAHAGVYRTPTKTVPCHTCKQSFKSILEYTNHCLTVHSKNQTDKDKAEAQSAIKD